MNWRPLVVVAMSLAMMAFVPFRALGQTRPSAATKASGADFSGESYRIVSRPDEIISVLQNGATVICKRVSSPVAR